MWHCHLLYFEYYSLCLTMYRERSLARPKSHSVLPTLVIQGGARPRYVYMRSRDEDRGKSQRMEGVKPQENSSSAIIYLSTCDLGACKIIMYFRQRLICTAVHSHSPLLFCDDDCNNTSLVDVAEVLLFPLKEWFRLSIVKQYQEFGRILRTPNPMPNLQISMAPNAKTPRMLIALQLARISLLLIHARTVSG